MVAARRCKRQSSFQRSGGVNAETTRSAQLVMAQSRLSGQESIAKKVVVETAFVEDVRCDETECINQRCLSARLKLLPTLLVSSTASAFCMVATFLRSVIERLRVSGIGLLEVRWDFFVLGSDDALLVQRSSASHPILRSRRHCALSTVFTWWMVSVLAFFRFWAACTTPARSSRGHGCS